MTLFEDQAASLSGSNSSNFLAEAMTESEGVRAADYATLPNVIKASTCRGSAPPTALIKHLVNRRCTPASAASKPTCSSSRTGERSGKHATCGGAVLVVEGSGYDLALGSQVGLPRSLPVGIGPRRRASSNGRRRLRLHSTVHHASALRNAGAECRIIVMSNRIVKDMGFDWYDQVEHAPGF